MENILRMILFIIENDTIDTPRPNYNNWRIGCAPSASVILRKSRGHLWRADNDLCQALFRALPEIQRNEYSGNPELIKEFYLYHI